MNNHTTGQVETHEVLAIVIENGSTFKVNYLDDAHGNSNHHGDIPLRGKSKILAQRESMDGTTAAEGMMIKVILGTKRDRRFGLLPNCVLGFRAA